MKHEKLLVHHKKMSLFPSCILPTIKCLVISFLPSNEWSKFFPSETLLCLPIEAIEGNTYMITGEEWTVYANTKVFHAFGYKKIDNVWVGKTELSPEIVEICCKKAYRLYNPIITTKCGLCREVGHWKPNCPVVAEERKRQQVETLQDKRYHRFRNQCSCGPRNYPSLCLKCKYACCEQAYQIVAHESNFTCVIHGITM